MFYYEYTWNSDGEIHLCGLYGLISVTSKILSVWLEEGILILIGDEKIDEEQIFPLLVRLIFGTWIEHFFFTQYNCIHLIERWHNIYRNTASIIPFSHLLPTHNEFRELILPNRIENSGHYDAVLCIGKLAIERIF